MKLIVVESPAKVKTIKKILGKGYRVTASMGHIVDLPKKEIGIDVEKNFEPKYVVTNRKALKKLKSDFKGIKTLVIASDLDREGEAIGWHIAQRLGVITKRGRIKPSKKLERIVFHSITRTEIEEAINNPRSIDMKLVDAQQARRILDRLVGYKLSPLLWKKLKYGLSAGRVQSVAVKIIVDRERERDKFKEKEYWRLFVDLKQKPSKGRVVTKIVLRENKEKEKEKFRGIRFELVKVDSKEPKIRTESKVKSVIKEVKPKDWKITR